MATTKSKRAAQGAGTIRQRPDGRWEARYTVGRDPGTGKQIQRSIYGATQAEVLKKLQQVSVELESGAYIEPSKMTVGQWLDIWLEEYLGNVKPRTVISYAEHCRLHIKPALGAVKLTKLSVHSIQSFYNALYRGSDGEPGLSAKTIKNLHGVLHRALEQAIKLGYLKFNSSSSWCLPRIERKEIKPLDEAETASFLNAIRGHVYEIVYLVTLFTGMRQGEVLGLTWDCVDFEVGTVLINKQLQRARDGSGRYQFISTKNGKGRTISPAKSIMSLLDARRREQIEQRLKAGSAWTEGDLVFTNEIGRNLSPQTVYLHFKKIVNEIGCPQARFHDLRHSYAVAALQSGDNIKMVQETLGHHTASFTLDTYAHVTEKMRRDSADRMDNYFNWVKNL